ncbi:hypothetical protein SmJEL517_g03253 [Synchytrium microbalum]|uniref:W2 domain-containing protein n=1 Tax=Synchytrium microbalum TaxID=1806994 RepID=A0A507C7U5_9FUNG|nr:uncharacterized protein SmJEL517_g03253 [Synchytrium microbalum]TPX34066.1 hypothetical protein SmJEL517_g03253 [Synchytrium microbalum]
MTKSPEIPILVPICCMILTITPTIIMTTAVYTDSITAGPSPASWTAQTSSPNNISMAFTPSRQTITIPIEESFFLLLSITATAAILGASLVTPISHNLNSCHHRHHNQPHNSNINNTRPTSPSSGPEMKRLQSSVNHLSKRRDVLLQEITSLRKDVVYERESRSVIERAFQERVKRVELDLEFKDTEVLQLRDRVQDLEDQIEDMSYSNGSATAAVAVPIAAQRPTVITKRSTDDADDDDDDGEDVNEESGSGSDQDSASSVDSTQMFFIPSHLLPLTSPYCVNMSAQVDTFRKTATEKIFQSLVCNVAPVSIVTDLEELANRALPYTHVNNNTNSSNISSSGHPSSSNSTTQQHLDQQCLNPKEMNAEERMRECLGVAGRGMVVFLEKKTFDEDVMHQTLARYTPLFNAFTESDADQVYLLQTLETFGDPSPATRNSHFAKLLMGMYRAEIVEPNAVVEWFQLAGGASVDNVRAKCKKFVDWLKSSMEEDSDSDDDDEEEDNADDEDGDADDKKQDTAQNIELPPIASRRPTPPPSVSEPEAEAEKELRAKNRPVSLIGIAMSRASSRSSDGSSSDYAKKQVTFCEQK